MATAIMRDEDGHSNYYIATAYVTVTSAWLSGVVNLLSTIAPSSNHYVAQAEHLMRHEHMGTGIVSHVVRQMQGVLLSAQVDWEGGLLRQIEYIVAASTFDEFLDHAETYHKSGKKTEAAVLASAVLEDAVKKVAQKANVPVEGKTLDPLIDALVKAGAITPVKGKRWKALAGVRNHAMHAEWDKFDIKDVGDLVAGTRDILVSHL